MAANALLATVGLAVAVLPGCGRLGFSLLDDEASPVSVEAGNGTGGRCDERDVDSDGDGFADCEDACADDPAKSLPGVCGCGTPDTDTDADGVEDCLDGCVHDAQKSAPGLCGCGSPDTDSDADGAAICLDGCEDDPQKSAPGLCGCGTPDTDSDGDGTVDCVDACPDDPRKLSPGVCGCGALDSDRDGIDDCSDACPSDNPDDSDENGVCDSQETCGDGIVSAFAGEACDDGANGDDCDGCFDDCTDPSSRVVGAFVFVSDRDGDNEIFYDDGAGNLLQLTDNEVNDDQPSWSPDGNTILFVSDRTGDGDIYRMDLDGGNQTRLTIEAGADHSPRMSPDSTKIAYVSAQTGDAEVFVMNADGTGKLNISNNPGNLDNEPEWSPDSARIAYIRVETGPAMFFVDANGVGGQRVDHLGVGGRPRWSPDGRWVAGWMIDGSWPAAYWDAATSQRFALFNNGGARIVRAISWHPGSQQYAYIRQETDPNEEIFELVVLDLAGAPMAQVRGADMGSSSSALCEWSPDGEDIAIVSSAEGNHELYAVSLECPTNRKNLTRNPSQDTSLAWRPR